MKLRRKTIFFLFGLITTISACDKLKFKSSCGEFYVKNELSSAVFLRNYKLIDSDIISHWIHLPLPPMKPEKLMKIAEV